MGTLKAPPFLARKGWQWEASLSVLFVAVYFIWFFYLERTVQPEYFLYSPLDDLIPFRAVFVLPYFAWFVFVPATAVYFFVFSGEEFRKLAAFLAVGMIFSLVVYSVWPNGHNLRPSLAPNGGLLVQWVAGLYGSDTSTNVCPSIHVLNTIACQSAIMLSPRLKGRWLVKTATMALSLAIIASTMLIKQHSILDGLWALPVALVLFVWVYGFAAPHSLFGPGLFTMNRSKTAK